MYASPFIDETFDIYNCHNYTLSIQCALDGFSFSIHDLTVNKFIVFAEYDLNTATPFELKNELTTIMDNEPILQQKYKNVKISYTTIETTLVPEALYRPEEMDALFELNFKRNRNDEVIANKTGHNYVLLSAIPKIIKDLFHKHFSNARFFAPTCALLNYFEQRHSHHNRLLVWQYKHSLYLVFQKEGFTQFSNSFFVKNETDSLYYLLNTMKQLQADAKTEIILMGKFESTSNFEALLKRYFEKVQMAHFSHQYSVSYTFYQEPEHFHLLTTELALCE